MQHVTGRVGQNRDRSSDAKDTHEIDFCGARLASNMSDVTDRGDRHEKVADRLGHVQRHVGHLVNVQQSARPGRVLFNVLFRVLLTRFVRTRINVVASRNVLRSQKVHQGIFVGYLFMVAKVVREDCPEDKAEHEENEGADENWQPEVDQKFHEMTLCKIRVQIVAAASRRSIEATTYAAYCGETPQPHEQDIAARSRSHESNLFPLDRRWRLRANIVADSIDAVDFVDDPGRHLSQHLVRQMSPVGGHEVVCVDASNHQRIVVGSRIAHHANALNRQQNCKKLRRLAIEARLNDLFDHNRVGLTQHFQFRLSHLAQATNRKPRTRERMPPHKVFRQTKLQTQTANFVFEQVTQRLD